MSEIFYFKYTNTVSFVKAALLGIEAIYLKLKKKKKWQRIQNPTNQLLFVQLKAMRH